MSRFGLSAEEEAEFNRIVVDPLKKQNVSVWVFGSRATGMHRTFSDIDVLFEINPQQSLPSGFLFELKESIEKSHFPYKVDLVDRKEMSKEYSAQIESEKISI